jgi:hypothetical protein
MERMGFRVAGCAALILAGAPLAAQSVKIYSEFQRLDPTGAIVAADKGARSREILSPAVIRNAWASFHVAVSVPEGVPYFLFLGQNPDGTLKPSIYRELYVRRGDAWIPDALKPLKISETGQVEDPVERRPGQSTIAYWLDLWVPAKTPAARMRLEAQLNVGEEWVVYPLEIRVLNPVLPALEGLMGPLAPVEASADASARESLRGSLCGAVKSEPEGPLTIRRLIRRNARQDMALARSMDAKCGKDVLMHGLLAFTAPGAELKAWCEAPAFPQGTGAEWYLRARDYLYRTTDRNCEVTITITPLGRRP